MKEDKELNIISLRIERLMAAFESTDRIRSTLNDWFSHYLVSDEYKEMDEQERSDAFFRYTELIEFFN